jgi:Arm domain-containing DNA-binding protein
MGSKWFTGGVVAAPQGRIQFDFTFKGIRYRPSIKRPPSEANLRRARERLESIKHQIRLDTFSFEEEFPDYRLLHRLSGDSKVRLCNDVFDAYLAHRESRLERDDMASATTEIFPSSPLDSPSLPPNLPPAIGKRPSYLARLAGRRTIFCCPQT